MTPRGSLAAPLLVLAAMTAAQNGAAPAPQAPPTVETLRARLAATIDAHGPRSREAAEATRLLAMLLWLRHELPEARRCAEQAVAIAADSDGADSALHARCLRQLGIVQEEQGEVDIARATYRGAADILAALGPSQEGEWARVVNSRGVLELETGQVDDARACFEQALAVWERSPPQGPDRAYCLNNLAVIGARTRDLEAARDLGERAVAEATAVGGPTFWPTAWFRSNLGAVLLALGDYEQARGQLETAVHDLAASLGDGDQRTIEARCNLACALLSEERFADGEQQARTALRAAEEHLGADHPLASRCASVLADLLYLVGKPQEALDELDRLRPRIARHGDGDDLQQTDRMRCVALRDLGRSAEALALARDLLDRAEQRFGPDDPAICPDLTLLAQVAGPADPALAEQCMRRTIAIGDGVNTPEQAMYDRLGLAMTCFRSGRLAEALELHRSGAELLDLVLRQTRPALAEGERLWYVAQYAGMRDRLLTLGASDDRFGVDAQLELVLRWKNQIARGVLQQRAWLRRHADPTTLSKLSRLQRIAAELAGAPAGSDVTPAAADLLAERKRLQDELSRLRAPAAVPPSVEGLRECLPADAVLLELAIYGHWDLAAAKGEAIPVEPRLVAFVVRKDHPVRRLDLGAMQPVQDALDAYLMLSSRRTGPLGDASRKALTAAAAAVDERLVRPITAGLEDARTLVVCPDGPLATVPFGILPDGDADHLLIERFEIRQVASSFDDLTAAPAPSCRAALLVGPETGGAAVALSDDARDGTSPSPLPYAARELDAVGTLLTTTGVDVRVLCGDAATEPAVAAAVAGCSIVHIASHGWFERSDAEERFAAALADLSRDVVLGHRHLPSLPELGRSAGIVLAPGAAGSAIANGILTADEISWLDLSACRLVVLSACETARGTHLRGEQLLGMRRSLRLAGARSSLTNLWRVDDRRASELITRFYHRLLHDHASPVAALRAAQLDLLAQCRAQLGDPATAVWGGWLLEGQ